VGLQSRYCKTSWGNGVPATSYDDGEVGSDEEELRLSQKGYWL